MYSSVSSDIGLNVIQDYIKTNKTNKNAILTWSMTMLGLYGSHVAMLLSTVI